MAVAAALVAAAQWVWGGEVWSTTHLMLLLLLLLSKSLVIHHVVVLASHLAVPALGRS